MTLTPSTMLALGTTAPRFSLPDTEGKTISLDDFKGKKALLVIFMCNHCPYVKHVADELAGLGCDYEARDVGIVAINSNDIKNHPHDSPEMMQREKMARGYTFPYLFDASQEIATAYEAACTPDFFLFDGTLKLFYRGQLDDSRPGTDEPVTGRDLRAALDAVLTGDSMPAKQQPSIGCNIKWKPGNEPKN